MWKYLIAFSLLFSAEVSAGKKILAVAGSTRDGSYNLMLARQAAEMAEVLGASVTFIDMSDMDIPPYDKDDEQRSGIPKDAKRFRDLMYHSDGVIISVPKFQTGYAVTLKNALDWSSRSPDKHYTTKAFEGKKFALMSTSAGKRGGERSVFMLMTAIRSIGGLPVLPQVSVPDSPRAFGDDEKLISPDLTLELQKEIEQLMK